MIKTPHQVDIVIPVFNGEQTIKRAIDSVLNQPLEFIGRIIIIDDGSSDRTKEVVNSMNCSLIYIETKVNGGVASARNRGIELATSNWIAFLDADDAWDSDKLKVQFERLVASDSDFICCNAGNESGGHDKIITSASLWRGNFIVTSSVVVKRAVVQNLTPLFASDMIFGEDYLAWFRILTMNNGYYVCKPLVKYFVSPEPHYRLIKISWCLLQILQKGMLFTLLSKLSLRSKLLNITSLSAGIFFSIFSILKRFVNSYFKKYLGLLN